MLMSKDNKSRIEGNNRITWFLKITLNKNIDLPNDIFVIKFNDLNEIVDNPIGEYTVCIELYVLIFMFIMLHIFRKMI